MIGQVLGHYRILSKIGEGGMGVVYRARDEVLGRDVAVKVVSQARAVGSVTRDHLLYEARASSALSHPNICTVHEVGEIAGELFIVMELVEGRPLSDMISRGALPVEGVLRYGVQISGALAHAHERNTVHRDLKSANIVVTPEGLVKILDFGLARRLPEGAMSGATLSMAPWEPPGAMSGTLAYMAPEILRGETGDHRVDLWALGVVLYEAAAGQLPFQGRTGFELSSAILQELPPALPSWIPPGLWAIIQRCLAKEPAQRYQRASEIQAALEAVQSASITASAAPNEPRGSGATVHRGVPHVRIRHGDVLLMIGTTKGAFLLRSTKERSRWEVGGPYFAGHAVYAMAFDNRKDRHRIWASTQSPLWGTLLRSTDDFGRIWTNPMDANVKFPADTGASLKNIWQICLGRADEPDVLYCGVEPAALFESRDAGYTWSIVRGLFDHPHRPRWMPGNGGLALHTILPDPARKERMYVAISAGGVYRTDDGGQTWQARNRGIRVVHLPERYPEFGQCIHKIALHPSQPDRLFLQNHWGLYRSDDGAENWNDIANGVPSDFGFPIVMHPRDAKCVYILPVESDEFRCTPEGRLRVFRTRNAGSSWEALARGLPQKGAHETVVRDAMSADTLDPAGIYFGTRSGVLYASSDEGKNWKKILEGLPAIVCVKAALTGEPRAAPRRKSARTTAPKRRPAPKRKSRRSKR
ncbi:MAG TPA: protein kinase [Bryobacteraceae bacterium]|nr:protein kinase [Bryobacteraceae bacterium]